MAIPNLSRPKPVYKHDHNGGVYEVQYQCPAADYPKGVPQPFGSDLISLRQVSGNPAAPGFIVVSEYEFKSRFTELRGLEPIEGEDTEGPKDGNDETGATAG